MPINKLFGSTTLRNLIQARTVDSKIKVVFGSKGGSRTDGRTIYVSDIPDSADPKARLMAEKSAYHEAEHVRALDEYQKTNPGATIPGLIGKMQSQCKPEHAELAANIWNAIEDARIDNTENDRYPGTIEKYRDATLAFNEKMDKTFMDRVPPPSKVLLMLWYKARDQYYEKHGVDGVNFGFSAEDEELFSQTLAPILPRIETLTGMDDSMTLAKEAYDKLVEAFKEPPPPPPPQPEKQPDDKNQKDTADDPDVDLDVDRSDSNPSSNPGDESSGDPKGAEQTDDQNSKVQPPGSDQAEPESEEDESGMGSGGEEVDDSEESGESDPGTTIAQALDAGQEALENNSELDINDLYKAVADRCSGIFYSVHPRASDIPYDYRKPQHSQGHILVANGNRFFAGTEGKIRRLLVDERAPKVRDSLRSGHKLDTRHLYRTAELQMGKMPMIWKDIQEGRKIDTAVSLIIDQSGSMEGPRWETVSFLTAALCKILDSLSVKYSVVGVDSYGSCSSMNKEGERVDDVRYFRYNSWGTRLNPNSIVLSINGGSTPTAEMVKIGLKELGNRTETRKVLMIMTDGEPCYTENNAVTPYAIEFCSTQIQAARKYGCKVFGFGIDIQGGSSSGTMKQIFGKGWVSLPNFTQNANRHASLIMQKLEEAFRE